MKTLLAILLIGFMATCVYGADIEAGQDNSVYCNPADSNWIETNGDTLKVRRKYSETYSRKTWIRFDLSGTTYNADAAAKFSITFIGMDFTPASSDILIVSGLDSGFSPPSGVLGTNWTETAITWYNAPGNDTDESYKIDTTSTSEIGRVVMNSATFSAGHVFEFTIDRIGDYVQSDGSVTIILALASYANGNECSFASAEHSTYDGPTLFVDTTSPSVPTNVEVDDVSETSSQISWDASTDDVAVKHYKVYRDDVYLATTTATSYTDTGLAKYSSYEYTVKAYDTSDNESDSSDVVQYGYRRFPFFIRPIASQNGVTDMSGMSTTAANTFVTASGGELYTNGNQIRFLGVNMASQACFPESDEADTFAEHFAKMGINCVRIHAIDRIEPNGLFDDLPTSDPGYMVDFDSTQLDKLDYFIYKLKSYGIYVDLQLHKSRVYPNMPSVDDGKNYPGMDIFYPDMITLQKDFAYDLLNHTNAYTNNKYKDEPAVAFIEINNENGLIHEWCGGRLLDGSLHQDYIDELKQQWRVWLSNKYTYTDTLEEAWLPSAGYGHGAEIANNGDFSSGMSSWVCQITSPASASHTIKDNEAPDGSDALEINVTSAGSYGWHVQFYQPSIHIVKDIPYTVSFWAKAETDRDVTSSLQMSSSPYTRYGEAADFTISTEWEEYKFVVTPSESDPTCRLNISNLGLDLGKVWFANISVKQGNTMFSSSIASMEQLSSTEHLTNGDFSSGTSSWYVAVTSPAAATYQVDQNSGPNNEDALNINVTTADTVDKWHVKFHQLISAVYADQPYILKFWAKADAVRTITTGLGSNASPWNISELRDVVIGTEWKEYRVVVCPDITESNVRVSFTNLAAQTGEIWFTNISLTTGIRAMKSGETLWSMDVFDLDEFDTRTRAAQKDWMRFLWDTEKDYYVDMKNYVKNTIGANGLVIGSQTYFSPAFIQAEMDVVDTHFYLGHPKDSSDPDNWSFYNYSMAGENGFNFASRNAPLSISDKPFVCTEYNHPNPGTYGSEAYLLASAYASLQKWDAIFAFTFYTYPHTAPSEYFHHFFNMCQEPVKVATFPAAASMLRRGDIERPDSMWEVTLSVEDVIDKIIQENTDGIGAKHFSFSNLHALQTPISIKAGNQTQFVNSIDSLPSVINSDAGDLVWDSDNKLVYIKSSLTKAVIGEAGQQTHNLGDGVSVTTTSTMQPGDWTAISLMVKEGNSFVAAGAKILITATGYTDNTHMVWKTGMGPEAFVTQGTSSSVGRNWGEASVLVEGITSTITLDNVSANDVQVWSLDEDGAREASLTVTNVGGDAAFTINKSYKTIWYEVEIAD